jgi:hypothetical protein
MRGIDLDIRATHGHAIEVKVKRLPDARSPEWDSIAVDDGAVPRGAAEGAWIRRGTGAHARFTPRVDQASLAIIASTFPLIDRMTGPEVARND